MSLSLTATNTLYATLYALPWLRALGASIGPRSEVSTVSHIDPDLLTLGSETFVADIASIGAATFHNGWVALARTEVGGRTFLGNASVIQSGRRLPDNCLIGVQSVAPREGLRPGSSWLGSPAFFLPRRQASQHFAESLTYKPPVRLVAYRLFVEFFRVVMPASLFYTLGTAITITAIRLPAHPPAVVMFAMPGLYLSAAAAVTLFVAALKWAIVGRYRSARRTSLGTLRPALRADHRTLRKLHRARFSHAGDRHSLAGDRAAPFRRPHGQAGLLRDYLHH